MIKYIFAFAVLLAACSPKNNTPIDPTIGNDCFEGRKVEKSIENVAVTVMSKMNRYYLVSGSTHYEPCELPAKYREEDMECTISADVLEIFPTERRAGTPIILKTIK